MASTLDANNKRDSVRRKVTALLLWIFLVFIYHLNGDFLPGDDATGNIAVATRLVQGRDPSFTPSQMPYMFFWDLQTAQGPRQEFIARWDGTELAGEPARELRASGRVKLRGADYYVVESIRSDRDTGERRYVNMFGPGAGASGLPVFLAGRLLAGPSLLHQPISLWYLGKAAASLFVAGSAAIVYLIGRRLVSHWESLLVALSYGLGTCVWSTSSQALWQHGPNEFFLALGTYFLVRLAAPPAETGRNRKEQAAAIASGFCYAWAGVCRPTTLIVVLCVGLYFLIFERRVFLAYAIGVLPPAIALGLYNDFYLGSPWAFGQTMAARAIALEKTGSPSIWQTPIWMGIAGHLISPSRGLFVFSPFLLFSLPGMYWSWRGKEWTVLRPLTIALALIILVESKHFDWWSGWAYGYRHIVDTTVLLAVFLFPAIHWIVRSVPFCGIYLVLVAWSIGVQTIGAFAYDLAGWNYRWLGSRLLLAGATSPTVVADKKEVQRLIRGEGARLLGDIHGNIDEPKYRYRLWSLSENEIGYYYRNFWDARSLKHRLMTMAKGGT